MKTKLEYYIHTYIMYYVLSIIYLLFELLDSGYY